MIDFFTYSLTQVFGFSLVLIRISGLCVVAPFFGGEQVPRQIRVLLALAMSFVIFPALALNIQALPSEPLSYLIIVAKELAIGLLIGFLVTAIFFGFQLGGRFISIHMGLSMARMLDPFSSDRTSAIGQILALLTLTIFLIINGHHLILRALYDSFDKIPVLQVSFHEGIFNHAIEMFNIVIRTSIRVAAPTMAALFAINIIFGFIARLIPRMNVFILSLPAKIGVGVIIVTIALPAIVNLFLRVINSVFRDIYMILNAF